MDKDLEKARDALRHRCGELLARPNVVATGVGRKISGGKPTDTLSVVCSVAHKLPASQLSAADRVPDEVEGVVTDVVETGRIRALQGHTGRHRPAPGGVSIGHREITAGTLGCLVKKGGESFILSNNHVLANSNNATPGDAVLQPGPFDGGTDPADRIASLSRFIPITFDPPVPRAFHRNLVDAAVAEGEFHDLKREIHWVGHLRGWRPRAQVAVGTLLQKTGRTTNYTTGRITAVNATVDVNYGGGRVARFRDQIITTPMSAGGDSGSLVADRENFAVGLLFAGSPLVTILNQIQHVRSLLRVEIV